MSEKKKNYNINKSKCFADVKYFKKPKCEKKILYISDSIDIQCDKVIAKENIKENVIILKEYSEINLFDEKNKDPALQIIYKMINNEKVQKQLYPRNMNKVKIHKGLKKWIKNLEESKEKKILVNIYENNNIELNWLYEKYLYNAFSMYEYGPIIAIIGARFNHSCNPNINFEFNKENGLIIFKTNKKIRKGEELYNTYINGNLSLKERREYLKEHYDFFCQCALCTTEYQ